MTKRSPRWTRDELILALDLYFRVSPTKISSDSKEIVALSEVLNSLPIHPQAEHREKFRNANGVYMKLCNFLRFDPNYTGKGLERGGKLEQEIWNEYANNTSELKAIAAAIREGVSDPASSSKPPDEDEEFPEGRILTQLHKTRERNPSIVRRKKQKVLGETGGLACEVCGFDFKKFYGELGDGFAECHHIKPLSDLPAAKSTRLSDLAIVCANCHRILHRSRPWKTVEELRSAIQTSTQ